MSRRNRSRSSNWGWRNPNRLAAAPDYHLVFAAWRGRTHTLFHVTDMPDATTAGEFATYLLASPSSPEWPLLFCEAVQASDSELARFAARSPERAEALRHWREDTPDLTVQLPPVATRRERSATSN